MNAGKIKYIFCLFGLYFFCAEAGAQIRPARIYDPAANARKDVTAAVAKAKAERKNVLIQTGGNWCSWCMEFNRFTQADAQIDSLLRADFITYHLNYSPENKNLSILESYKFPQRFGFPVLLVLDENGKLIHTQNSSYLEQGKSYNKKKIIVFLQQWNSAALDPYSYKK